MNTIALDDLGAELDAHAFVVRVYGSIAGGGSLGARSLSGSREMF